MALITIFCSHRFVAKTGSFDSFAAAEANSPIYYTTTNNTGDEYAYDMAFVKGSDTEESKFIVAVSKYNGSDNDFYAIAFAVNWDNTNSKYDVNY